MPRPGPRPYECVRRAWHSDRHQPIRGSLIQEIFRLANEVHCNATRNNKEWQEKLPFVVLRAEEIMYSKANSEAEYIDLKTLWDRANDAIDTIIRKDDANESGDLLPPCIEAALTLGCIPRRASRSQRHSNPVCYLSSNPKEPAHPPQKPQDIRNTHHLSPTSMPPLPPVHSGQLHSSLTPFPSKQAALGPEIQFLLPNPSKEQKPSNKELHFLESSIWPNLGRVYPPYYGSAEPCSFTAPPLSTPEFSIKPLPSIECDLSLRLGRQPPPTTEAESSRVQELEDVGSSSSCDGTKSCLRLPDTAGTRNLESVISPGRDKGFQFFALDEHCESFSSKRCFQSECVYTANVRHKIRKPSATVMLTDGCFSWKL